MPYRPSDDEIAQNMRRWYANHPEQNPQSTYSRVLDAVGLDEPFAKDSRSYDYRKKARDEYAAAKDPRASEWSLPEVPDEVKYNVGAGLEKTLGGLAPLVQELHPQNLAHWFQQAAGGLNPGGYDPVEHRDAVTLQDPLHDQAFLTRVQGMTPDQIEDELAQWQPKSDPFPESWKGKRKGAADPVAGGIAYGGEQVNYSPYDTSQILSLFSDDAPETVGKNMNRFSTQNPEAAEALDVAGIAAMMPLEVMAVGKLLGRGAKAAGRGARKVAGATRRRMMGDSVVMRDPIPTAPAPRRFQQPIATPQPNRFREVPPDDLRETLKRATRASVRGGD